jgi:hypothetical protein
MQPTNPYAPPPQPGQPQSYDFIMNSGQQPKRPIMPGSNNLLVRVILVAGLLLVLLITFIFVRKLLNGPSNYPYLLEVAQDQTAILHVVDAAEQQTGLTEQNMNFALTTDLAMNSARSELTSYMRQAHFKVKGKELGLKISSKTDTRLSEAAAASTYNETFQAVMNEQLDAYQNDLKTAYNHTKGKNGRELLSNQHDAADLLRKQLDSR